MIIKFRKSKLSKIVASFLLINLVAEIVSPSVAFALTGGPSQPEVQSFQPIGTSDMVDVFSGDFNYNIPLIDVGGYPVNISYNSAPTMDEEASWVGLGWNINPGVINRNMRGLPDDFNGEDQVHQEFNMEPNRTYGLSVGATLETFGLDFIGGGFSLGVNYNNYNGIGFSQSINFSLSGTSNSAEGNTGSLGVSLTASPDGLDVSPSASFSDKAKDSKGKETNLGMKIGVSMNSRAGLKSLTLGVQSGGKESADESRFNRANGDGASSSPISLMPNTYVPQMDFPRLNFALSLSVKFAGSFFGVDADWSIAGSYNESRLLHRSKKLPAYGYLYEQNRGNEDKLMLDFNREKDGPFTKNTTNLPVTNHTYDVYSVAGQGIGGMFRPFRGEVGSLYDSYTNSISGSGTVALELGVGNVAHTGVDVSVNAVTSNIGNWERGNVILDNLNFRKSTKDNLYEAAYFKQAGEKSVDDEIAFKNSIGGFDAVKIPIHGVGFQSKTKPEFRNKANVSTAVSAPIYRTERVKRNQSISYLKKSEAQFFGVDGYTSSYGKKDHLSEMSVVRTDGARYVYGIPAYNITQREVSFNASEGNGDCITGLVSFTADDASSDNEKGMDHYYNATTTPAFAHSYLLTSVLSADYVDVDNVRGPSAGDLGGYTKFVYDGDGDATNGSQPSIANYRWRTPYKATQASYSEGLKTDKVDDRGSYMYGEKELWYVDRIETKSYIAIFHKSKRADGYEAAGEMTTTALVGEDAMSKLDSISLYSLPDWKANGSAATPIKRVHFRYDYQLCAGILNNNGLPVDENGTSPSVSGKPDINLAKGKLTLTKIFFTYGNSRKGKLSGYEFKYSDLNHNDDNTETLIDNNFDYDIKGYDRWGHYARNNANNCDLTSGSSNLPPSDYPYVEQDKAKSDRYSSAWSITDIKLPSGGKIEVDYEADDYAYVQDKEAMQMFKVSASGENVGDNPSVALGGGTTLYSNAGVGTTPYKYLFFPLQTSGITTAQMNSKYIKNLIGNYMYFRFLTNLTDVASSSEYVSGYAQVEEAGVHPSNSAYGYVKIKSVNQGDGVTSGAQCNPISKSAWNFGRSHNPRLVYNMPDPSGGTSARDVILGMANASIINGVVNMFKGANGEFRTKGYARNFIQDKSWIRLYSPENKIGGGCRVKQIRMKDNWDTMGGAGAIAATYGQEYEYTLTDGTTSSGVAAYEPLLGGDENVFHQPVFFTEKHLLADDAKHYLEEPFGESFFPSPSVGYGRITVKNLQRKDGSGDLIVKKHATGYVVHEFYTAKDFPTITDRTAVDPLPQKSFPLASIFSISIKDYMTATQGYKIELNDMHGKQKAQWVYAEGQTTPISGVEYKYKTKPTNSKQLENTVVVIDKDKNVSYKEVGVDFDFITDFRESNTKSRTIAPQGNLAAFLASILPLTIPTIWPNLSSQKTRFRSAVTTKVINRYGILAKTTAYDLGSEVSTEDLAYDSETGTPLLNKTVNEFNDPVYNFSYPAHWAYDRMGQAYKNINYELDVSSLTTTTGFVSAPSAVVKDIIARGDEVILQNISTPIGKAWVWDTDELPQNGFYLIDVNGAAIPKTYLGSTITTIKVIRSGRRNMPDMPIGTITSSANPLVDLVGSDGLYDNIQFNATTTKILNASANEYSDSWGIFCNEAAKYITPATTIVTPNIAVIDAYNDLYSYLATSPGGFCADQIVNSSFFPGAVSPPPTANYDAVNCSSTAAFNYSIDFGSGPVGFTITPITSAGANISPLPFGLTWNDIVSVHVDAATCSPNYLNTATATLVFNNGTSTFTCQGRIGSASTGFALFGTCTPGVACETSLEASVVNPYVVGIKGNWRPIKSYAFLTDRTSNIVSNNTSIRHDGEYTSFNTFWAPPTGAGLPWMPPASPSAVNWTYTSEVTKYSPFSFEIENKDALDRYSAALYGYNNTLPKAVASNAKYNQIAFDGFEDYGFTYPADCCPGHFDYYDDKSRRVLTQSHTGRFSMELQTSGTGLNTITSSRPLTTAAPTTGADNMPYTIKGNDINGLFGPEVYGYVGTKEYVVSYWIKQANNISNIRMFDYPNTQLNVKVNGVIRVPLSIQKSDIIDKWQRVEYRFTISNTDVGSIAFEFVNSDVSLNAYIDDIRVQPFNSSMKTYVYDPLTLRLWAELDERNFATFYEYDEEGALLRVKKETEKGIMTIKESRNSSVKQ